MLVRITPILFVLLFAGCEGMQGPRGMGDYQTSPSEAQVAGIEVVPLGYVAEPFEPDVRYEFVTGQPVILSVKYAAPDGGKPSDFTALVAPKIPGGRYSIEVIGTPTPLLVITDSNAYVTGKRPAVGGGQTGTLGDGTTFILEPAVNGSDFVYLLKGGSVMGFDLSVDPIALDENNPLTLEWHYRGFRWDAVGHGPVLKIEDGMDPDRKNAMDRMIRLAESENLYPPK